MEAVSSNHLVDFYDKCSSSPPTPATIGHHLPVAVCRGDIPKVETLLAIGIHVNQPAHIIQLLDYLPTHQLLYRFHECGYDFAGQPNEWLLTPLQVAVIINDESMVELLLAHNADLDIPTYGGVTPLVLAVMLGCFKIAQQLLKAGAEPNAQTVLHRTALHYAVEAGDHDMVKVLLSSGAQVHVYDVEDRTPVFVAIDLGLEDIVATLTSHAAENEDGEDEKFNVVHYAALENHAYNILSRLVEKDGYADLLMFDKLSLQTLLFCSDDEGKKKIMEIVDKCAIRRKTPKGSPVKE